MIHESQHGYDNPCGVDIMQDSNHTQKLDAVKRQREETRQSQQSERVLQ